MREEVFNRLKNLQIPYEVSTHPAVYTIEEMEELGICSQGEVYKNLFLRDAKGKRHFLVIVNKDKKVDLKKIQEQIGCTRLSFASEERLQKYLHISKGAVTPMGIINDTDRAVEIVIDRDIIGHPKIGVHPNDNTATIWISYDNLVRFIKSHGYRVEYITI